MLSKKMLDAINDQIGYEFYSWYVYLQMSAHFETANLQGFAAWFQKQAADEQTHAMKFYTYVNDRGSKVTLPAIPQPKNAWKTSLELFEEVLKHEQGVTARIHKLNAMAIEEMDSATQAMLQWFIPEQVEEEKPVSAVIEQLRLIDARGTAVLMLDHRLAKEGAKA
jgi:ferritin